MTKIPVFDPIITGAEKKYLERALESRSLSGTSPLVDEFENRFAQWVGAKHAVACANGTAALHLALMALGVKPGDEVIVPSFTIISNAIAVVLCGAKPVFVDVSPKDWCIDSAKVEAAVTSKTVGMMAVHLFGNLCDMDALNAIASKHRLWLLEDAAQAQGGAWKEKAAGTIGTVGCFSFYANKLITTGEGGAVVTFDAQLSGRLKKLRNLAFDPTPARRFIHDELGHNYRMSGLQAAFGLGQLEGIDGLWRERERVRNLYRDALTPLQGAIELPISDDRSRSTFWMMAFTLAEKISVTVADVQTRLAEAGVETRRLFYPLHRQPALAKFLPAQKDYPVSDRLFERGLYLPSSSHLDDKTIQSIVDQLAVGVDWHTFHPIRR